MDELFKETIDVSDVAIFRCEQLVSLCCKIIPRDFSFVLFGTHAPFQTLPLAREESEQTCQGGLELRHSSHIFQHKLRSARRSSEQRVPKRKYIAAQGLSDSSTTNRHGRFLDFA
jgi:hypothetical protein